MARKSRKNTGTVHIKDPKQLTDKTIKIYKTAIYARLSVEDSGKGRKDTIESQIEIVKGYIEAQPHLHLCTVYQDNAHTGTNFYRKGFIDMMNAVKHGDIDCIVVKDLSRFGRSYIETGDYLEKIFPFTGTRFISVNDNYDNQAADFVSGYDGLLMSLRSLMDDVYAKDISCKTSSSVEIRQRRGDFIGLHAAYGYMKSPFDKTKLIIDVETSSIVRDIFNWKLDGLSNIAIARRLNDIGIHAPNRYRYEKGILKNKCHANVLWQQQTIKSILKNHVYIGCLSQGKTKQRLYRGMKDRRRTTADEWIIIHDSHEAIIEKSVFEAVGSIMEGISAAYHARSASSHASSGNHNNNCNSHHNNADNIFRGIVRCADCGSNLVRDKETSKAGADGSKKVRYVYVCQRYEQLKEQGCKGVRKYITEEMLKAVVWAAIKAQMDLCTDMVSLISEIQSGNNAESKKVAITKRVTETQYKIARLDSLLQSLYDDFADGVFTQDEYIFAKKKFIRERETLSQKAEELEVVLTARSPYCVNENKWVPAASQFSNQSELTKDMLAALIDHISISERNNINIVFGFRDEIGLCR